MMSLRALGWTTPLGLACALVLFGCAGSGQESPPPAETPAAETPPPAAGGPPQLARAHEPDPGAPGGAGPGAGPADGPSPHGELQWATPAGWTAEKPRVPTAAVTIAVIAGQLAMMMGVSTMTVLITRLPSGGISSSRGA